MASYASLAELKAVLRITDSDDDTALQLCLDAATTLIDQAMGTEAAQLSPVPAAIKLACELQATRFFKRKDAAFGVLGSPEFGTYSRLQDRLDPDVELLLGTHGERLAYGTTV